MFGEARDGCGRVINNLRAVQSQNPRALGEMAVVADINSDTRVTGRKDGIARIARREIKFFPEAGMAVRDVVLAVLAEVAPVGVDQRGGIEEHAGHLDFVDGRDMNTEVEPGEIWD